MMSRVSTRQALWRDQPHSSVVKRTKCSSMEMEEGERRHQQQQEEDHGQHLAERQVMEHRRHGHEGEPRPGGRVNPRGRQHREDHQHRDQARQGHHPDPGAQRTVAIGQIGAIGGVDPRPMEREKNASPRASSTPARSDGRNRATGTGAPGQGARHGEPGHHQQQHHHEQGRHHPAQRPLHPCCNPPCTNHQVSPAKTRW